MLSCNINGLRANVLITFIILLNVISNRYICPIDETLTITTTQGPCGSEFNDNRKLTLHNQYPESFHQLLFSDIPKAPFLG